MIVEALGRIVRVVVLEFVLDAQVATAFGATTELGPGQALFVSINGQVYQLTWDGTAFDNLFHVNFPLYGRNWDLDPRFTQAPDSRLDQNDQIDAIGLRSLPLPPTDIIIERPRSGR